MTPTFIRYNGPEKAIKGTRIWPGLIGVVVRTDRDGGVFRGHMDIWFGGHTAIEGGAVLAPLTITVLADHCEVIPLDEIPLGEH